MPDTQRFKDALARFDAANAADPNGKELAYAERMTAWLARLEPNASEPLRLAVRCQHIQRWMIPRERYPMDRRGYHQWRTTLQGFHAETAGRILREVGYDDVLIGRVQRLLQKKGLKDDPETQTLEDCACLVFLEGYFSDFSRKHDRDKLIEILRKTWAKMTPRGRQAALALPLSPADRALVEAAVR